MGKIFFSSDHHFGHKKLIENKHRSFSDIEKMNDDLVEAWNSTVDVNDTVYYVGDMFCCCKSDMASEIIKSLNGKIIYVLGNHDELIEKKKIDIKRFESIQDLVELKTNKKLLEIN